MKNFDSFEFNQENIFVSGAGDFFIGPPFCYLLIKMFISSMGWSHNHSEQ